MTVQPGSIPSTDSPVILSPSPAGNSPVILSPSPAGRQREESLAQNEISGMSNAPATATGSPTLAKEIRLRDLSAEARRAKADGLSLVIGLSAVAFRPRLWAEALAKADGIIGEFVILSEAPKGRSEESLPKECFPA